MAAAPAAALQTAVTEWAAPALEDGTEREPFPAWCAREAPALPRTHACAAAPWLDSDTRIVQDALGFLSTAGDADAAAGVAGRAVAGAVEGGALPATLPAACGTAALQGGALRLASLTSRFTTAVHAPAAAAGADSEQPLHTALAASADTSRAVAAAAATLQRQWQLQAIAAAALHAAWPAGRVSGLSAVAPQCSELRGQAASLAAAATAAPDALQDAAAAQLVSPALQFALPAVAVQPWHALSQPPAHDCPSPGITLLHHWLWGGVRDAEAGGAPALLTFLPALGMACAGATELLGALAPSRRWLRQYATDTLHWGVSVAGALATLAPAAPPSSVTSPIVVHTARLLARAAVLLAPAPVVAEHVATATLPARAPLPALTQVWAEGGTLAPWPPHNATVPWVRDAVAGGAAMPLQEVDTAAWLTGASKHLSVQAPGAVPWSVLARWGGFTEHAVPEKGRGTALSQPWAHCPALDDDEGGGEGGLSRAAWQWLLSGGGVAALSAEETAAALSARHELCTWLVPALTPAQTAAAATLRAAAASKGWLPPAP